VIDGQQHSSAGLLLMKSAQIIESCCIALQAVAAGLEEVQARVRIYRRHNCFSSMLIARRLKQDKVV
jgi:hypothetical protein